MSTELLIAFILAAVVLSVSPGAGAVNTMSHGLRLGIWRTLPSILGQQVGVVVQLVVVGIGLGALLASSVLAFTLLKWLGVLYLIWLGVQKWREPALAMTDGEVPVMSGWKRFWQGALVNTLNPKATVFLVAFLPQFIDPTAARLPQFLQMGAVLVVVDIVVMLGYASLASLLRGWFSNPARQQLQNRLFGSLFVVAGGALASYSR
ncbi:MAG: homoserine/homoserine lactone efflux protein [Marinobacterium sp.]|nr:homoserine/homoserine lactone efflux protein [Marinobacterium sp.]